MAPRELSSAADLLHASAGDDFVRWHVDPSDDVPARAWALDEGVAWLREGQHGPTLTVVAPILVAAQTVHDLVPAFGGRARVTVPQGTLPLLDARIGDGGEWEWMRTRTPPPVQDGEPRVRLLGPDDEPEVQALLDAHSPRHSLDTGDEGAVRWFGLRSDDGALAACVAHERMVPGAAALASVVTAAEHRGRGLGAAVTAAVTRACLADGFDVVTLGMYSDNDVARRMYQRLGFVGGYRWSSRAVVVR
jgi:ribosomal protein S18 acetylase RimI-like enzyme